MRTSGTASPFSLCNVYFGSAYSGLARGAVQTEKVDMFRGSGAPIDTYAGTWFITAGMALLALTGAAYLGFSFDGQSAVKAATAVAIPGSLHLFYTKIRPDIYIASLCGAVAVLFVCAIIGGTLSLVGLGIEAPLVDATLARIDATMGFNLDQFVRSIARIPGAISLLRFCYGTILTVVMLTAVILVLLKRFDRLWEFCFVYAGTLTTCALISGFVPAIGAFVHYSLGRDLLEQLPREAGVYHLTQFTAFRFEGQRLINLFKFDGVVSFPSFHCCMALLTAYAYRGFRRATLFIYPFSAFVIISCMPIGGHYLIDVVGGALVWATFVAMTRLRVPNLAFLVTPGHRRVRFSFASDSAIKEDQSV